MFKLASAILAAALAAGLPVWAQTPAAAPSDATGAPKVDKASSYYHYALAHMYAELAGAYGNRGGYLDKAIENYKAAIQADPGTPQLTEELSELYIGTGRLREAQSDAEDALRQDPNDIGARRLLARVFTSQIGDQQRNRIDENMLNKAIEQYQKITAIDPKDVDSLVMLGRLQKIAQNSNAAEASYKKALEIDPENEDALTGLAIVYSDLGDSTRAAETLSKMKNPSAKSLRALAGTYEQMKEYGLAAQALQRALETNPADASDLKHALAEDQSRNKQYDAAIKTLQDVVSEDPTDAQAFLEMSRVYREMKDLAKASAMSDKAKALDPDNLDIRYNAIGILRSEGKMQDAIRLMTDLLAATQKRTYSEEERGLRVQLLAELAQMYTTADQIDAAVDAWHQAGDLDPSRAPLMAAEVINAYRDDKDLAKAAKEADAALKQWPADASVVMAHAMVLADNGQIDPAAAEVKKLADGKNDRRIDLALSEVYGKGRRFDEMAKVLDAAEKLSTTNEEKIEVWFQRGAMFERERRSTPRKPNSARFSRSIRRTTGR